ncbi:MAG: peptidase C1 [Bacteroidetes bacterium]|nr:MAG: peptidase C1 [Bacteroidota bacterium]
MAIKMEKDNPNSKEQDYRSKGSRRKSSGGGMAGPVGNIAGALLPMLIKKPKLLLIVLGIAVVAYFLLGKSCSSSNSPLNSQAIQSLFNTGGLFNKEIYEETEIYEPLADNKKNPLPESVTLKQFCPTPLNQGKQGSCVAWASAYAARTILEAKRTGANPNKIRYSPSFMYNQISTDRRTCQGSYIKYAMDNLMKVGAVGFQDFPYDDDDCSRKPGNRLIQDAQVNKIKGFQRLTEKDKGKSHEMLAMKQNLAKGSPVIIGMMVGGSFMNNMMGKDVWFPTNSDFNQSGFGGHAMCVIGYDDYKEGGAFQIMNSWGEKWGKGGFCWVRYSDFKEFNREAYGLYPMGDVFKNEENRFKGSFGLQLNQGKRNIQLRQAGPFYYETTEALKAGDKFKVEFTNNIECYTYIFGEDDDKSIDVLFPYTPKHSPYCGITGTRLFPRDYSMVPNEHGEVDRIAILITKEPIDYDVYNKKINEASGNNLEEKIRSAFQYNRGFTSYGASQSIDFEMNKGKDAMAFFVIGVRK